jgi:hypothetical protein
MAQTPVPHEGRPVDAAGLERAGNDSGIVIGETRTDGKTTATTGDDQYKTEFVKVYQDAGVVGVSMLTLLVLCVLLGLFCSRLIKMYISLTNSRDAVESARSAAIEKLTMGVVLLRSETSAAIAEFRREGTETANKLTRIQSFLDDNNHEHGRLITVLDEIKTAVQSIEQESSRDRQAKLEHLERLLSGNGRTQGGVE